MEKENQGSITQISDSFIYSCYPRRKVPGVTLTIRLKCGFSDAIAKGI
ncbi:MAG: hypothetical protein F6K41_15885 [Symploca sp. SIO3E6]|nr:hypothetical protein [Caldora sp. SIO3E6]